MVSLVHQQYKLLNIDPNFKGTVIYHNDIKYTGEWKNGLKAGNGVLENPLIKFKVKIKEGKILKCLKVLHISQSINHSPYEFLLPNIRIFKEKDYYQEEFSDKGQSSFFFEGYQSLFDGKHYRYCNIRQFSVYYGKMYVLQLTQSKISPLIVDFIYKSMRFIGPCAYLNPIGKCKVIIQNTTFKGNMKGLLNVGTCTFKNENFKAFIEFDLKGIKNRLTVIIIELGFEISAQYSASSRYIIPDKTGRNLEIAYACIPQISNFVNKSLLRHNYIIKALLKFGLSSNITTHTFVVEKNWRSLEYDLKQRKRMIDSLEEINSESSDLDERCLKIFHNKERYEGKVVNGKFDGFGKYFYSDGSVYVGEFQKNLRSGLGTFKFSDGRLYRGHWVDNMMHGKGCIISGGKTFYGNWDMNKLKQGGLCIYYDL